MYIKSIDLVGFKSFIDKTQLRLEPGISCVVGPNGSGKSNVADAVRWVVGEQNPRSLRGQKMEDVIFSGSGKRKAIGMAEVTLTIDNSTGELPLEFNEVTVTRRAYRSGEGEYLINGKTCRLKDIYNLFVDSGITSDSFAMVGQGRIHEIVSMKPEERRCLIEEAAGIIRYRNRKREAMRKLDNTQRNLERVGDIIGELAQRIGPLEEQAQKARSCQEMTETADELEIGLITQVLGECREKLAAVQSEHHALEKEAAQKEGELAAAEAKGEELRLESTGLTEAVNQKQQTLFELSTAKEKQEARMGVAQAQEKAAAENKSRLEEEMAALTSKDGGFVDLVAEKEAAQEIVTDKLAIAATDLQELEKQLTEEKNQVTDLAQQVEMAKEEAFDLASQMAQMKNEILYQDQQIATARQSLLKIETEFAAMGEVQEKAVAERNRLEKALQETEAQSSKTKAELAKLLQNGETRDKAKRQWAEQEVSLRYALNSQQSRLQMLQELAEKYEGYYPGVRALLLAAKKTNPPVSGICGVMAELLTVQSGCEVALDAALAGSLQNIVVKTEKEARLAIEYLKNNKSGRVTLLPLDAIKPRENPNIKKVLSMAGVVGRGIDLVQCRPEIQPAAAFLLNQLLVVENLQVASKAARELQYQCKIVTLDGDMVNPGGAMTGGSREKRSGDLLSRKEEIQKLRQQVADLSQQAQKAKKELANLEQAEETAKAMQSRLRDSLQELEMSKLVLVKDLQHLDQTSGNEERQRQSLLWEKEKQEKEIASLSKRQKDLQEQLAHWQETDAQLTQNISQVQKVYETAATQLEATRLKEADAKVAYARLQEEARNLAGEIQRLKGEKTGLFQEIAEKERQLAHFTTEQSRCQADYNEAKASLQALEWQSHEQQKDLATSRHQLQLLEENVQKQEKWAKDLRKQVEEAKEGLHLQEVKQAKLETEWENETAKLQENFQLTYEEAALRAPQEISRREATGRLRELRRNIAALGPVNMGAIAEYAEVKERYEFLTAQREDLLAARKSLDKVIREMDSIMNRRFQETFYRVSEEFNKVFNRLFGGGKASLSLTDPENLLETGVELLVEPPGKKLTNYNLLSGGEKALIGISLMFGIFQVRPSPLCVLDEVDAALDEANVDRFGEYLQELSRHTQFLLISHRQGTMEAAQALWGVTMEEEGISKVVSVKLSDLQEEVS